MIYVTKILIEKKQEKEGKFYKKEKLHLISMSENIRY